MRWCVKALGARVASGARGARVAPACRVDRGRSDPQRAACCLLTVFGLGTSQIETQTVGVKYGEHCRLGWYFNKAYCGKMKIGRVGFFHHSQL